MMSRIGITTLLAIGALMGSSGVAVGASALSTDTTSSAAQYGQPNKSETLSGSSGPGTPPGGGNVGSPPGGDTAPLEQSSQGQTAPATAAVQAPRQLEASQAQQLPFTGYGLIPILLIGMLLLAGGLVLRRRTLSLQAQAHA